MTEIHRISYFYVYKPSLKIENNINTLTCRKSDIIVFKWAKKTVFCGIGKKHCLLKMIPCVTGPFPLKQHVAFIKAIRKK